MSSNLLCRRDVEFLLYEWLQVENLCAREHYEGHDRQTFDAALELAEQLATERFAPYNKKGDQQEPTFDGERVTTLAELPGALRAFADAGLLAGDKDASVGGMQLPVAVERACFAWFLAANYGFACYPLLTMANAALLLRHGSDEQRATYVAPMLAGRFTGTMCLSEPQAGSSLAEIRTRAEPQADGSYRLFGNKMWISAGEHEAAENIVHLVLARTPNAPPGVHGLSLFLVPRRLVNGDGGLGKRNDVALAGLNHKMGVRATVNCLLNFGEGRFPVEGVPGAKGWMVGERNRGLATMFLMMNEARIAVGLSAAALGYTAYLHSLDYARQRPQGRAAKSAGGEAEPIPIIGHADVRRMLLAQKAYAEGALALVLYCARLVDDERTLDEAGRRRAVALLDVLTPIAKSWPSQWCLKGCELAIQVHGGYGYTRDYNVEQFYRDNRLNPIHEGTTGIQALDLLGRKVGQEAGFGWRELLSEMRGTVSRAHSDPRLSAFGEALAARVTRVEQVTDGLLKASDRVDALANATPYLDAVGHLVLAWIWLELALAAGPEPGDFYEGKRRAAEYFFRWELPAIDPWLDRLEAADHTFSEMEDQWF